MTLAGSASGASDRAALVGRPAAEPGQASVLFVCTANQCRSPFAAAIARRYASRRQFLIGSGGLIDGGRPVPANGLVVASELGLDLAGHRSRQVDRFDLAGWDLILTMTREHVRELIVADPLLWPRVFTIKQFRRWIENDPALVAGKLGESIDVSAAGRSRLEAIGASPADDIGDPVRSPVRAWRRMADEMNGELAAIFGKLSAD